jgi:hypothetical protein
MNSGQNFVDKGFFICLQGFGMTTEGMNKTQRMQQVFVDTYVSILF